MSVSHEVTANVHGATVNVSEEYHTARNLMGLKTTNQEALLGATVTVYLNIGHSEDKWLEAYANLINEMQDRIALIAQINLGLVQPHHFSEA